MSFMSILYTFLYTLTWVIVPLVTILYVYSLHHYNYWKNKGVPYIKGEFPFGSLKQLFLQKSTSVETFVQFYNELDGKYAGFYSFFTPQLLIKDLDLIKNVMVKDFNVFVNRGVYHDENIDPLSAHLFSIEGTYWKNLRAKLSPTFSSGKMKMMFPTVKECAMELQRYGGKLLSKGDILDIKDITGRFGLDVISSTALGLEGNNFKEDNTPMRRATRLFSAPSTIQMIRMTFGMMCKRLAKLLRLRFVSKEVEDYFFHVVKENTEYREKNNVRRNDFMQLLIDLKNNKADSQSNGSASGNDTKVNLTLKEMAAQSFVFVVAGYETTSVTMGFCLYELALNPEIQDKLIAEIDAAGDDISYDVLNQLPYLEMVINETLRKYPPVPALQRECSSNYVLPGGEVVEKGTLFVIPVIGLHLDPKLFPNPNKFDPERFNKENIKEIKPYSYLPFGEGPRICIGMRFGKMQVKTALVAFLSRFRVEVCNKTAIPFTIEKKSFLYNVEGGVWLRVLERNKNLQ